MKKHFSHNYIIIIITLIGAAMRIYNMNGMSLMNDELSALMRTHFNNFHDLIYKGIATEGHPAGVQLFLFAWVHLFGDDVWVLRLPFVITGILCVPLTYLIASNWFNKNCGIFAALSLALLQYPILYSQLARMYSTGMFFVLLFAWIWTELFFSKKTLSESKLKGLRIGYVLAGAGCMYSHYFAFFVFVIIVFAGGIFLVRSKSLKDYIIISAIAFATFLPHIKLFFIQFGLGGVGSWLPPPDEHTFGNYLDLLFNNSGVIFYLFTGILIVTFVVRRKVLVLNKFHLLALVIFLLPFIAAYYYSIYRNPLLQVTTLLFGFPFLLMFIFSFVPPETALPKLSGQLLILGSVLFCSTVFNKKYYSTYHYGEFKQLAKWTVEFDETLGEKNITHVCNVLNGDYMQYYLKKWNKNVDFMQTIVYNDSTWNRFKELLSNSNTENFLYEYSNIPNYPQTEQLILEKYPFIVFKKDLFNSGFAVYSKNISPFSKMKTLFKEEIDFENDQWKLNPDLYSTEQFHHGKRSVNISETEFSPGFGKKITEMKGLQGNYLSASVFAYTSVDSIDAVLVVSIDKKGENILWKGAEMKTLLKKNEWTKISCITKLPEKSGGSEDVKVYIWNRKKQNLLMDDFEVLVLKNQE